MVADEFQDIQRALTKAGTFSYVNRASVCTHVQALAFARADCARRDRPWAPGPRLCASVRSVLTVAPASSPSPGARVWPPPPLTPFTNTLHGRPLRSGPHL
jgi:hypothetical protein